MDINERKEFEKFLKENPQYQVTVDSVSDAITAMNNTPSLKVSKSFDQSLNNKIKALNKTSEASKGIFGFSRQNFAYLSLSVICIFLLSAYLLQPSDSAYMVADEDISIEEGIKASELCCINIIACLKEAINNKWEKLDTFVKLGGYVNCLENFTDHPKIINGASDLLINIFQEKGKHTRFAIGSNSLPMNISVEIDAIIKIK